MDLRTVKKEKKKSQKAIGILILQPQNTFFTESLNGSCHVLKLEALAAPVPRYRPPLKSLPLTAQMWKLRPRKGKHHVQGQRVSWGQRQV